MILPSDLSGHEWMIYCILFMFFVFFLEKEMSSVDGFYFEFRSKKQKCKCHKNRCQVSVFFFF